jgi:hypothetical protein
MSRFARRLDRFIASPTPDYARLARKRQLLIPSWLRNSLRILLVTLVIAVPESEASASTTNMN